MRNVFLSLSLLVLSPGLALAQSGASVASDEWEFALTPFLWASGMDGTVGFGGQSGDFEASAKDLIKQLDFALMANFQGRRGRWSFSTDFDYTNLGKDVAVDNPNIAARNPRLDMTMTIIEGDVGYQLAKSFDVLGGVRGVSSTAGLVADGGTIREVDGGFADPIVGARFHRYLSEKFWVNLRGDVGGFGVGSDFSWFVNAAGGFRVSKLISLELGYRIWNFDYESDDDLKRLDLTLGGFGGGLTFHF